MPENLQLASKRTFFDVVRFLLLLALVGMIGFGIIMMVNIRPATDDLASLNKVVQVQPGMSAGQIADLLDKEEIITNPFLFRLVVRVKRAEKSLQAGYYLLNPAMGSLEIIDHLRNGAVTTEKVVIPEGFEIKQIAALLEDRGLADKERFIELAQDAELVFGDSIPLDLPIASLEGYLFPDTYRFSLGQTEEEIIVQMVNRLIKVISGEVAELLEESDFTLHEVLTLASIVEREIMVDWERPIVASVYLNRLAINMPLQADPTVRYVMTEDRSRVLYRDLEIESPYNTYRNRGLPPGPIASPGLDSLLAVFNPEETDYFFFVSKRDGTHQFSRTYDDHLKARRMLGY